MICHGARFLSLMQFAWKIMEGEVSVFCVEDTGIYLAFHGTVELFSKLRGTGPSGPIRNSEMRFSKTPNPGTNNVVYYTYCTTYLQ